MAIHGNEGKHGTYLVYCKHSWEMLRGSRVTACVLFTYTVRQSCVELFCSLFCPCCNHLPPSTLTTCTTCLSLSLLSSHRSPLTALLSPLSTHCSPLTPLLSLLSSHYSPLTALHSLLSSHSSPLTALLSLLSSHCSPLTALLSLLSSHCSPLAALATSG